MEHDLINNQQFGVLTVDTTYNLGNFYVTAVSYPARFNNIQVTITVLQHHSTIFSVFNYFTNPLVGCSLNLCHILAFGSDGDKALV